MIAVLAYTYFVETRVNPILSQYNCCVRYLTFIFIVISYYVTMLYGMYENMVIEVTTSDGEHSTLRIKDWVGTFATYWEQFKATEEGKRFTNLFNEIFENHNYADYEFWNQFFDKLKQGFQYANTAKREESCQVLGIEKQICEIRSLKQLYENNPNLKNKYKNKNKNKNNQNNDGSMNDEDLEMLYLSEKLVIAKYRKLAKKWHPDRHTSNEKKKIANDKMIEINNAKEFLIEQIREY